MATSPLTLPLSDIVNVSVIVSPQAVQGPAFNQALIVGNSGTIPSYGVPNARCRQYSGGTAILQNMLQDGWHLTDPEYIAASWYVAQSPTPYYLWIGRQDASAVGAFTIAAPGTNYKVGDRVTVVQTGASNGVLQVATIGTGGTVTALQYVTQGTGYVVATNLVCSGGSGTGLQISITGIGESCLQAVQACRVVSSLWYLFTVLTAVDTDNLALAQWAQTAAPVAQLFYQTSSTNVPTGDVANIFNQIKAANYNRCIGIYSTTQIVNSVPTAPNNTYISCAAMGVAMGRNTGLAGSYFILPFKNLVGMSVEPLTNAQFLSITAANGNAYCSYANTYNSLSPCVTGSAQYFDQILGIDMLVSDLQYTITNALYLYPAISQTDQGQSILLHAANTACEKSTTRGFLSGGTWQGPVVLNLQPGTAVPLGYFNQSPSYASLGGKPANRQAAPIYCAVLLSEAAQSVVVAVYVQQ